MNGKNDWVQNTANLRAGDEFTITASVPEPSSITLMLVAMAMGGLVVMKRHK